MHVLPYKYNDTPAEEIQHWDKWNTCLGNVEAVR